MALLEAADSSERVVVVITTAGETDAFAGDTEALSSALREVSSLLARKELVLRASGEADLPKILARRLFKTDIHHLPERSAVATGYADAADAAHSAGLDLPTDMLGAGFANTISTCSRHAPGPGSPSPSTSRFSTTASGCTQPWATAPPPKPTATTSPPRRPNKRSRTCPRSLTHLKHHAQGLDLAYPSSSAICWYV